MKLPHASRQDSEDRPPDDDTSNHAPSSPTVAHPAAGDLKQGIPDLKCRENKSHLDRPKLEGAANLVLHLHDAHAVEIGEKRQAAGKSEDAEADVGGVPIGGN